MTCERDICRSANLFIKRYGSAAVIEAAKRADELLANGDLEGCGVWQRVVSAIRGLRWKLEPGDRLH